MNPSIIDVSSNNGVIDFNKVFTAMTPDAVDGKKRVVIRTSEGVGCKDKMCAKYAADATAAGLTVSYYHLAYSDVRSGGTVAADSEAEADYFCDTIQALPPYEFLVIDLETPSPLTQTEYADWLQNFVDHVYGRTSSSVILYSNKDYLDRMLPDHHAFGNSKLWIANYGQHATPALPKLFKSYFMWQFSETGTIDGMGGHVDCSKFNPSNI